MASNFGIAPYYTQLPDYIDYADIRQAFSDLYFGNTGTTPAADSLYGWLTNLQDQITVISGNVSTGGEVYPGPNPPTVTQAGVTVPDGWVWVDSAATTSFYQYNASAIFSSTAPTTNLANGLIWVDSSSSAAAGDLAGAVITARFVSQVPLSTKGYAGQTANLFEWKDSSNNVLNYIDNGGYVGSWRIRVTNSNQTVYSFSQMDDGKLVVFTNTTGAINVTMLGPTDAGYYNFPIGTQINVTFGVTPSSTSNFVRLVAGTNVTLGSPNGLYLRDGYALCTLVKIASSPDKWVVTGGTAE